MHTNKVAGLFATILLAIPVVGSAHQYTVTNMGVVNGLTNSYATGINENGEVTGYSQPLQAGAEVAFLYSNGALQPLAPSNDDSVAYGINSKGQVTGYLGDHAFVYSDGTLYLAHRLHYSYGYAINESGQITGSYSPNGSIYSSAFLYSVHGAVLDLGNLGGLTTIGYSINASGQVTGYSWTADPDGLGPPHAFFYSNGTMQDLGTLGGDSSYGQAINAGGEITGGAATATSGSHAFLYSNGTMQDLGTLGGTESYGYGINSGGQVTGQAYTKKREIHAFLYAGGHMIDLNLRISTTDAQTYTLTSGRGINDKGQIVVDATVNATGNSAALLLTPTEHDDESN